MQSLQLIESGMFQNLPSKSIQSEAASRNFLCAAWAQKNCKNMQYFVHKKIDFAYPEKAHCLHI
jgi:hypothetical protein